MINERLDINDYNEVKDCTYKGERYQVAEWIFRKRDNSDKNTKRYDIDVAIKEICDSIDKYGFRDSAQSLNSKLLQATSNLNPTDNRKECYDDYVDIVSNISNLTRKCCSVSGSYKSYTSETHELFEVISEKRDKFN